MMPEDNFNKYCEALLAKYTRRNTQTVTQRLESLCAFLRQDGNHVVQTMFGGSVQKGTYVTGLSDVDVLLVLNQSSLLNRPPSDVLQYVQDTIQGRFPSNSVSAGKLAVTVKYADGAEIQLLPAIRTKTGIRIAEPGSTQWSDVAQPERFAEKLAQVNTARDGGVVPVVKLAKAMADCFITRRSRKIKGYHMVSLAVDAFRDYQGPLDPKAMLVHFLGYSMKAVLHPVTDSTGQSRYVDEYLGDAVSRSRQRASTYFGQMRGKVKSCETRAAFNALFCIGD